MAMNVKSKYLVVLREPFSLDMPYADRQRVVIVPDEQVDAERRSRAGETMESQDAGMPVTSDVDDTDEGSSAAAIGRLVSLSGE